MNEKEKEFIFIDPANIFPRCFTVMIFSNSTNILARGSYQKGDIDTSEASQKAIMVMSILSNGNTDGEAIKLLAS